MNSTDSVKHYTTVIPALSSTPKPKVLTSAFLGKLITTPVKELEAIDSLIARPRMLVLLTVLFELALSKVFSLITFSLCCWAVARLIWRNLVMLTVSTRTTMPVAQLNQVSKEFPEKRLAVELIQTGFHLKLWMATERAVELELTTLNS